MHWDAMSSQERWQTLNNMETYGGGFTKALAEAWLRADAGNCYKLALAFPELVEKFQPKNWSAQ